MSKGRKKLPDSIKIMQGTDRKDRMTGTSLIPSKFDYVPLPPEWFTPLAELIYQDVTSELLAKKLLEKVDISLVVSFCNLIALHQECEKALRTKRIYYTIDKNFNRIPNLHPLHKVSMDALHQAKQIASEFGFTPLARQRLMHQANNEDESRDDFT